MKRFNAVFEWFWKFYILGFMTYALVASYLDGKTWLFSFLIGYAIFYVTLKGGWTAAKWMFLAVWPTHRERVRLEVAEAFIARAFDVLPPGRERREVGMFLLEGWMGVGHFEFHDKSSSQRWKAMEENRAEDIPWRTRYAFRQAFDVLGNLDEEGMEKAFLMKDGPVYDLGGGIWDRRSASIQAQSDYPGRSHCECCRMPWYVPYYGRQILGHNILLLRKNETTSNQGFFPICEECWQALIAAGHESDIINYVRIAYEKYWQDDEEHPWADYVRSTQVEIDTYKKELVS